jgi:uncharacterized membrane protein YeiB
MDFKNLFSQTWQLFVANLVPLVLSTFVYIAVSVVSFGIMAPVLTAGYMHSILLLVREKRKPKIRDLFGQMRLFFPLLGFLILIGIVVMIGLKILVLPGIAAMIALSYFCLFMLPLMTDEGLGLVEAIRESSRMALEPPVGEYIVVIIIFLVINSIGNSTGIGILFTQPLATIFIMLVYEIKKRRLLPSSHATGQGTSGFTAPPPPPGKA